MTTTASTRRRELVAGAESSGYAAGSEILTPDDLEREFKIPKSTQAKARMTGNFCPYIKRGARVYYFRSDVLKWLESLKRRHTSDPGTEAM